MDSNRLHYFSVVAETGGVRKAAEALRLSPAALSKAIKLLERETGLRLLVPSGRGIAVTREGKELAKRARPVLDELANLAERIRAEGTQPGSVARVGSFEVFTTHFLGSLLDAFPKDCSLVLREAVPGELERILRAGEIDLGVTYIPVPTAGVDHLKVTAIRMGVFARHGIFEHLPFGKIPFVIPVQPLTGSPNKVQGLDGWPDGKIPRNVRYRVTLMESAMELCRKGVAAAYLPSFVVRLHNRSVRPELQLRELPAPISLRLMSQTVYIARRKEDPEDGLVRRVARILRSVEGGIT